MGSTLSSRFRLIVKDTLQSKNYYVLNFFHHVCQRGYCLKSIVEEILNFSQPIIIWIFIIHMLKPPETLKLNFMFVLNLSPYICLNF